MFNSIYYLDLELSNLASIFIVFVYPMKNKNIFLYIYL